MSLIYKCDMCDKTYDSIPEFKFTNGSNTIMILCNAYKSDAEENLVLMSHIFVSIVLNLYYQEFRRCPVLIMILILFDMIERKTKLLFIPPVVEL